jgi:hypothetical protein
VRLAPQPPQPRSRPLAVVAPVGVQVLSVRVRNYHPPFLPPLLSSNPPSRSDIHPIPFRCFRRYTSDFQSLA